MGKIIKKELFFIFIVLIFTLLSAKALFHTGFFRTIDDITTIRIEYLRREIVRNNFLNNFPVRMSGELANGFGYPLYLFYAPLTYYVGSFLMIVFNLSDIVATKYIYVLPLLVGPVGFYLVARQKVGVFSAIVASALFTFFPYRAYNTYVRGAVAEAWAMAFIPFVFWGVFLLFNKKKIGGPIFALSYFLVLVSHNLVGMMFSVFLVVYGLLFFKRDKNFWLFFALGLGLAAFYLVPMVFYLKIIKVTHLDINKTYVLQTLEPISQLVNLHLGQSVERVSGFFSLILFGGLAFFVYLKQKTKKVAKETYFWGIAGIIIYLLLFSPSAFFWKQTAGTFGILQFVWRILAILGFIIPLFLALLIENIKSIKFKVLLAAVVVVFAFQFSNSFKPGEYSYFYNYEIAGDCATTSWQDEYLPVWVDVCPRSKGPLDTPSMDDAKIDVKFNSPLSINAQVTVHKNTELVVNKFYFPGWHVYIDGKDTKLKWPYSQDGQFSAQIESGQHNVDVIYKKTTVMWIADFVSLVSFGVFLYLLLKYKSDFNQKRTVYKKRNRES